MRRPLPPEVGMLPAEGSVSPARIREFWRDNGILGGAAVAAGLINYGYHVVLAHLLGPSDYGELATLLNLTELMGLPASVVTLIYTRVGKRAQSAALESAGLWAFGIAIWAAVAYWSRPLARLARVDPCLLLLFTLEIIPSLAAGANTGILQRIRRYLAVAVLTVLANGFRVFAAGLAGLAGHRLITLGALEAVAAGVTWAVSRFLTLGDIPGGDAGSWPLIGATALAGLIGVVGAVADGIVGKHNLGSVPAGQFNGLATIGHAVPYIAASLGTVMLTSILADPHMRHRFLGITLLVYLGVAAVAAIFFAGFPGSVVRLILGSHYGPMAQYLPRYGWGMMALGLVNIGLYYAVAAKDWPPIAAAGLGIGYWVVRMASVHQVSDLVRLTAVATSETAAAVGLLSFGGTALEELRRLWRTIRRKGEA